MKVSSDGVEVNQSYCYSSTYKERLQDDYVSSEVSTRPKYSVLYLTSTFVTRL